jgi:serine-type D-Ala-D-Ala endopeptidase (penicillin-binding protein 7)
MKQFFVALMAVISLSAQATPATLVYDLSDNHIVSQQGNDTPRPIASLSKLMTAMVVLDSTAPMNELLTINQRVGTQLPQREYSRLELLHAMLVKSDNAAAETLAENHPGGRSVFMFMMNLKARDLNLSETQFVDPSGLSIFNVSTAREVGAMLVAANQYELIRNISTLKEVRLEAPKKKRAISFVNTNYNVLSQFKDIVVSKTGFTNPAGFCMGLILNRQGHEFVVVVLGEKNKHQRAATVNRIMRELS